MNSTANDLRMRSSLNHLEKSGGGGEGPWLQRIERPIQKMLNRRTGDYIVKSNTYRERENKSAPMRIGDNENYAPIYALHVHIII